MTENRLTIFAIAVMLAIGILFFLWFKDNSPRYSWSENYRTENDQPYGTLFIRKLLEGYRPEGSFTLNTKEPLKSALRTVESPETTDYVFIGYDIYLDSGSANSLVRLVEAGGNAFISSLAPPEQILDLVYIAECDVPMEYIEHRAASVGLNFYHSQFHAENDVEYTYRVGADEFPYPWRYVDEKVFCDSTRSVVPLGYMDTVGVNFVRIPVGKGNVYLHTNPLVFTNYFLTDEIRVAYVSAVFSHLDGNGIIWDEFSKVPLAGHNTSYNSPLYYILSQPALKYAWWLLLLTVLIYVLFAAKRKQKIIQVIEPKINTSLEFVKMIARLHYENGNHLDMAHKKMQYFLYFVRLKYGIHAERFEDGQMQRLAEKSRVSLSDIQIIFSRYNLIRERFAYNIEAGRLVDLYDAIDKFYRQSKLK